MNDGLGYALAALGLIGLLGMAFVFMTARLNDRLDAQTIDAREVDVGDMVPNQPYRQWFDGERLRIEHIPLEDFYSVDAQETPTRQRQDRNGLGPKDGGSVAESGAPEHQSDTPS